MALPLIPEDAHLALFAFLLACVAGSFWLGRTRLGKVLSPVPFVVLIAVFSSNLGLVPLSAPAYTFAAQYFLWLAIPLMLFDADLRAIVTVSRTVILAFAIGVVATLTGAAVALAIHPVGALTPAVSALYSAVATGGMVNMLSVGEATGVFERNPELLGALIGGSVPLDICYLALANQLTKIGPVARRFEERVGTVPDHAQESGEDDTDRWPPLLSLMTLVALSAIICAVSKFVAASLGIDDFAIVLIGTFALALANIAPRFFKRLHSQQPLGIMLLMVFLAAVTVGSDLGQMTGLAVQIFAFVAILYTVHVALHYAACWWFRIDLPTAVIGSVAGIFGPSVTAAIAGAQNWPRLLLPGVMCALLGVAFGTYLGILAFALLT